MIPSQDQIPYNGIESNYNSQRNNCSKPSLKTKFRITELKVSPQPAQPYFVLSLKTKFRITELKDQTASSFADVTPRLKTKFRITELKG